MISAVWSSLLRPGMHHGLRHGFSSAVHKGFRQGRFRWGSAVSLLAVLASCKPPSPPPPPADIHYVVGPAWQAEGMWHYPRELFEYRETGLAVVDAPETEPRLTADGELYDPKAMTGAHQTLQLPSIVTVRNLDNGRQITIRLNDRGPVSRGRLLSLTPQAAAALGMGDGPAKVEIIEEGLPSRGFAEQLPGGPMLDMRAAPRAQVTEEALASPAASSPGATGAQNNAVTLAPGGTAGGAGQSAGQHGGPGAVPPRITALPALPVAVQQGWVTAGALWVEAGRFTLHQYAAIAAARASGRVWPENDARGMSWVVRIGPFSSVEEADAALDRALRDGATGAHIVVE